jgi:ubiquinone/menaquinone biosynthesis C-methylase UbiE
MNKTEFFNRWAPSYDWLLPSVFYQAVHVRLLDYVQLPPAATVLEMGCGTGKLLNRLAQSTPSLIGIGVDLSSGMIEQAKRKTPFGDRLQFIEANVTALPFDGAEFDAVFCSISFLHYPDPDRALREVARVLKPGGQFYLADFTPPHWATSETILRDVSPEGVRFYNAQAREALGERAGLSGDRHVYLLGPVMMSQFTRP